MPKRPKRPCRYPGCPNLCEKGTYCAEHQGESPERWRGSAAERGYGADWRKARRRFLASNPLCAACPFLRLCGGGCPRMRKEVFSAAKGGLCGHRLFLEHALERMAAIARRLPR